ncbi:DUF6445 family protein [Sphingomonas alpina]|uniref:Uncharacterized protein n=1 Tax=Sphingomonas alpina TaxID=653931 RepID=A0A7H0LGE1_9SPHN|nr:DUF6445 family protein [Sphingomonas alpina]QNQ08744.1 hypothetical protein H3Z74_18725 [Sphingomonas alpina]
MTRPDFIVHHLGNEAQPLVIIDDFAPDPEALRAAAIAGRFGPASHHYPGIRAPLPASYLPGQQALIAKALCEVFDHHGPMEVIDASFSIVTTPPAELTMVQRLPHCDAYAVERIALLHYLAPGSGEGTAFFRHRSTGFETVSEARAPIYFDQLEAELRYGGVPPARYIANDTTLFERTMLAEARYNRALLYRSYMLHSGAIAPESPLSPDPSTGRLTITGFLSAG